MGGQHHSSAIAVASSGIPASLAVAWMDGRSPDAWPVGWREQVLGLGTDLHSSAVLTLSLTTPHLTHGPHTNFLYGESEQKMFRDWTELTLFRAETVPETVPVLSLLSRFIHHTKERSFSLVY